MTTVQEAEIQSIRRELDELKQQVQELIDVTYGIYRAVRSASYDAGIRKDYMDFILTPTDACEQRIQSIIYKHDQECLIA